MGVATKSKSKKKVISVGESNDRNTIKDDIRKRIFSIFNDCQNTMTVHRRAVGMMTTLLHRCDVSGQSDQFNSTVLSVVDRVLVHYNKDLPVERICRFISQWIAAISVRNLNGNNEQQEVEEDDEREQDSSQTNGNSSKSKDSISPEMIQCQENFIVTLLKFLVGRSSSHEKSVRFRSTLLIADTLNALCEDYEFDNQLWAQLTNSIMMKSFDRLGGIRRQSIHCLARLQDHSDPDDQVTNRLIEMIYHDPIPEIRQTAVTHLVITKRTLKIILERTLDQNVQVRKEAFNSIATKIDMKVIPLTLRMGLLKNGLQESDPTVKEICSSMLINHWLKSLDDNLFKLLHYFKVEMFEKETELALLNIFQHGMFLDHYHQFEWQAMNNNHAIYLHVLSPSFVEPSSAECKSSTTRSIEQPSRSTNGEANRWQYR
ncbi:hypothetical protein PPL_09477 [Heterostelium album PN500]|uniref:Condensin complex subunit 3 n=1 Tax=Heterostelium pallidum (strain ATCC 26659 / Pp 5 / PN500) TaxID=670386 RepID=D3BPK8_HETP5|nr:hypothetical protein PPL_09477 [Heterostelium album PN500]EFA76726.1 hypothetical protein PPL_09477 [Heterostelium album PN500]|eukprot:XP_020428858.1 hypothetical protein PPL_09477 [Heterostelium album PN500]